MIDGDLSASAYRMVYKMIYMKSRSRVKAYVGICILVSICFPLYYISYDFVNISIQLPESSKQIIGKYEFPISTRHFNPLLIILGVGFVFIWGLINLWVQIQFFKKPGKFGVTQYIISAFFSFVATVGLSSPICIFQTFKEQQFLKFKESQSLLINQDGLQIPFFLIFGDPSPFEFISHPIQKMMVKNTPSIEVKWDQIVSWKVISIHGSRAVHRLYRVRFLDASEILLDRTLLCQACDVRIVEILSSYIGNRLTVEDDLLD